MINKGIIKILIITAITGLFVVSSCTKEQSAGNGRNTNSIDNFVIPAGFSWESSRDVYFDINIKDSRFQDSMYVVSIYDTDPLEGGRLLSKGAASTTTHFLTKVYLPNTLNNVFIVRTAPDNSFTTQKVEVTGTRLALSMATHGSNDDNLIVPDKIKGVGASPNCSTGCDATVTSTNNSLTVNNSDVTCVTGSNITIKPTLKTNAVLRICGTNVSVVNASLGNGASIIVTSSGSATFTGLDLNSGSESLINYGTATISGDFTLDGGDITNEGTLTVNGDLDIASGSEFTNDGTITVNGTTDINTTNSPSTATNNGSFTTTSTFTLNSSKSFINNCFLWIKGSYSNKGTMKNYDLIKVAGTTSVNTGTEIGLYAGAELLTSGLTLTGTATLRGYTSSSLVKVTGTSTLNTGSFVKDLLQYCDANGIETNHATFSGGAALACSLYIPVTNCNTEGNGTPPVVDSDGDGILDPLDEYPSDATKAFNNYYPNISPSSGATVAFEDKWPLKGDYDMNDLVMSYRYKIVTNAINKVVQVVGNYTLQATGGYYKNGFGVEFPVLRSAVSGLTGGTLESGQTNAVIVLFTNMREEMLQWNTKPGDPVSATKDYAITFNISGAPALSAFGLGDYNPFIWTNEGRGYEVHLAGKTPTSLATTSLLGTGDDRSSIAAAKYYVTASGLPWAISMPVKTFSYPTEETSIVSAYTKFQSWAESGGSQFTDWYSNLGVGYRDLSKLFP